MYAKANIDIKQYYFESVVTEIFLHNFVSLSNIDYKK